MVIRCLELAEVKKAPHFKYIPIQRLISFSVGAMALLETSLYLKCKNPSIQVRDEYVKLLEMFHSISKVVKLLEYWSYEYCP